MFKYILSLLFLLSLNAFSYMPCTSDIYCSGWSYCDTKVWQCKCPWWSIAEPWLWCINIDKWAWWFQSEDLPNMLDNIWGIIGNVILIISIVVVVWSWISYSLAVWDDEKQSKAKRILIYALVAVVIVILAKNFTWMFMNMFL